MPPVPEDLLVGLRRARDRIDRDYAEPLDLDALAVTAGLSKYHFLRCFARTYGLTPRAYLTERRVERAQDLLRATNLTVTEVCWLVGYGALGSFSARFRRLVGCSPSEYQARWARTGAPRIPGCFVLMHGLSDRTAQRSRSVDPDRAIAEKPVEPRPAGESSA
jgi:AraC-like DNA-binding protein